MNKEVRGTQGYANAVQEFILATLSIDFQELHKDFTAFIPKKKARVLDVGAGIGRDASVFTQMGHTVVAIEPCQAFRVAGKKLYESSNIQWINDSLPKLQLLGSEANQFDFVLASGVWHHLNQQEQQEALGRIAHLLSYQGIFALSLRHGLAGVGTHVFPINTQDTIQWASSLGLRILLCLENQASLMKHKKNVTWTRLILSKISVNS